jgi:protease I
VIEDIDSRSVLIFIEDGYEDMELMYPKYRLEEAGYRVVIAGPKAGQQYLGKHGYPCNSDASISEMDETDFAGVLCPGGWAPDKLRRLDKVKALVAEFHESRKLIAAICHGGWIPISAGVYRGARVTGSPGIKDDLVNAGANFEDSAVVVDRHFVSARKPDDLPVFLPGMLKVLAEFIPVPGKVVLPDYHKIKSL